MKTKVDFLNKTSVKRRLVNILIRHCGGWKSFQDIAKNFPETGITAKTKGFGYYTYTNDVFNKHQALIMETFCGKINSSLVGYLIKQTSYSEIDILLSLSFRDTENRISHVGYWTTLAVFEYLCKEYNS